MLHTIPYKAVAGQDQTSFSKTWWPDQKNPLYRSNTSWLVQDHLISPRPSWAVMTTRSLKGPSHFGESEWRLEALLEPFLTFSNLVASFCVLHKPFSAFPVFHVTRIILNMFWQNPTFSFSCFCIALVLL